MNKHDRPLSYLDRRTGVRMVSVPFPVSVYKVLRDFADERDCSLSEIVALLVVEELSRDYLNDLEVRNG